MTLRNGEIAAGDKIGQTGGARNWSIIGDDTVDALLSVRVIGPLK